MRSILLICLLLVSGAGMRAQIPELGVSKRMVDTCTINFDHPEAEIISGCMPEFFWMTVPEVWFLSFYRHTFYDPGAAA